MEKLIFNSMLKKVIALVVMFSMFTGILSPFAQVKADIIGGTKYVEFTANGKETSSSMKVESSKKVYMNYGLTLTGGPVFNNLQIFAEDITEDKTLPSTTIAFESMPNATVSANRESIVFTDNLNSGYSQEGRLMLSFRKNRKLCRI